MRCTWAETDDMREYHDEEWGVPLHDDAKLFELITLEGAQAGLSWLTVLRRRPGYRKAFVNFDPARVARFSPDRIDRLLNDDGIIRHRGKIESTVSNAKTIVGLQKSDRSLNDVLWSFVDNTPRQHNWKKEPNIPATSPEADRMSKELKKLGFRFLGPTTCYAFMQATGMVNDHHPTCFRCAEVSSLH
jgi:DNA-3-methyladenine glycosylase I